MASKRTKKTKAPKFLYRQPGRNFCTSTLSELCFEEGLEDGDAVEVFKLEGVKKISLQLASK